MTAHLDKLEALKDNPKLPAIDQPKVMEAFDRYRDWQKALNETTGTPSEIISSFIKATSFDLLLEEKKPKKPLLS